MIYNIKCAKGYWLPEGTGYTHDRSEAGRFLAEDLQHYNLDHCTLYRDRDEEVRRDPDPHRFPSPL